MPDIPLINKMSRVNNIALESLAKSLNARVHWLQISNPPFSSQHLVFLHIVVSATRSSKNISLNFVKACPVPTFLLNMEFFNERWILWWYKIFWLTGFTTYKSWILNSSLLVSIHSNRQQKVLIQTKCDSVCARATFTLPIQYFTFFFLHETTV